MLIFFYTMNMKNFEGYRCFNILYVLYGCRLYKLWPPSSALIYGKVLLVNSTNEDLPSVFAEAVEL